MNAPVEVYVLCADRSFRTGKTFLDSFAPSRRPVTDELPFPELSDSPVVCLKDADEAIRRLESENNEGYSLHWSCEDDQPFPHAMLVFTEDGSMIAGLVVPEEEAAGLLSKIAKVVSGRFGYITGEGRPPDSTEAFINICRRSTIPTLVDGELRNKDVII
ncbi:hypothetical protein AYO47_02280 [Planctomyces sp. SCGC AG-212-M04]|nr:hypothetical protein AYO47_02280 [Planctomyces sp. SCGC AG-212-M04]